MNPENVLHLRNYLLILTMWLGFLRASEAANLKFEDYFIRPQKINQKQGLSLVIKIYKTKTDVERELVILSKKGKV